MDNSIKFYYEVYGLKVASEIELKELITVDEIEEDEIDVQVYLDKAPNYIKEKIKSGIEQEYEKGYMWFKGGRDGIFIVKDGNTICIETLENYDLAMLKIYIMGIAFSMLMIQREKVSIHGGAVDLMGKGILIVGDSGAGKSTLTMALREKGYKLLSDDMSAIDNTENGNILINPSFPMQRIGTDVIEKFGYNKEKYNKIYLTREKYLVSVNNSFQHESKPLKVFFHLSEGNVNEVTVKEVKGSEKLKLVLNSIFRVSIFNQIGITKSYLNKCLSIAKEVPMYKIVRPSNIISTDRQIQIIENVVENIS